MNGEDVATCPSCSLLLKVIYDPEQFVDGSSEEQVVINNNSGPKAKAATAED